MKPIRIILIVAVVVFQSSVEVACRRKHHRKENPWEKFMDTVSDGVKESSKFISHQLRNPHKNKGWLSGRSSSSESDERRGHHGRRSSDESRSRKRSHHKHRSEGISREDEGYSRADDDRNSDKQSLAEGFKNFVKNLNCEESPVYQKFFTLYKKALKKIDGKQASWIKELTDQVNEGNNKEMCPAKSRCDTREDLKSQNANLESKPNNQKMTMSPQTNETPTSAPSKSNVETGPTNQTTQTATTANPNVETTTTVSIAATPNIETTTKVAIPN